MEKDTSLNTDSLHTANDEALILAFYKGSQPACDALAERWVAPLYRSMRFAGWSPTDAEDLTQEVLLHVVQTRFTGHHYQPEKGRFTTWIKRIALNASLEAARKKNRRPSILPLLMDVSQPAQRLSADDVELLDVAMTLDALSQEEKTFLKEWKEGQSQRAIAEQMGLAESTLSEIKQRSLEKVRCWLHQRGVL